MNSWHEFHLVPASRPYVALPEYNLMGANIPLTYRRIDLTSYIGKTIQSQSGEWEFYIDYDKWSDWATCYRALVHYFHGFKMAVRLKDHDAERLYVGRFIVQNYAPGGDYSKITIQYYLEPTAETDPNALNLHFMVWWLDWDGSPISYEKIPWGENSPDPGDGYEPGEGGGSGGGSGDLDNQTYVPELPVEIRITKKPPTLLYSKGAPIDYSGISVVAYNSKGSIWTASSKYPNGVIPYSELAFPISTAAFPSPQTLPVKWSRPVDYSILSSTFSVTVIDESGDMGGDDLIMRTYVSYINNDVTFISDYAFYRYTDLKMASFRNVSKIGRYAFDYTSLSSLYLLYNGNVSIENIDDLTNHAGLTIYVPSSLYSTYRTANVWSNYSSRFHSYSE